MQYIAKKKSTLAQGLFIYKISKMSILLVWQGSSKLKLSIFTIEILSVARILV